MTTPTTKAAEKARIAHANRILRQGRKSAHILFKRLATNTEADYVDWDRVEAGLRWTCLGCGKTQIMPVCGCGDHAHDGEVDRMALERKADHAIDTK